MLTVDNIREVLDSNSKDLTKEFKRIFHGRGGYYEGWNFLTVDSINNLLFVAFYAEVDKKLEDETLGMLKDFIQTSIHTTILLQRRYIHKTSTEIIEGELDDDIYAYENGLKFKLNLLSHQNIGYFPDMKNGREFIKDASKNKNVLNLFSYTCGFSLAALDGDASSVVNIDMSKGALSVGRENHHLNDFDTRKVSFLPHNILKSFGKIKKLSPFDIVIIDPPTFQKRSFEATKDYEKIVKKLEDITSEGSIVLACLNSPDLDSSFIIDKFKEFAPNFVFDKQLENVKKFVALDQQKSLKNLVFRRV